MDLYRLADLQGSANGVGAAGQFAPVGTGQQMDILGGPAVDMSPSRLRIVPLWSVRTITVPVSDRKSRADAITGALAVSNSPHSSRSECRECSPSGSGAR
jgi:hypothetical protein